MEEGDAQFQLLVEGISDYALFMLDPEGRVLTWNSGAERFSGFQSGEMIGNHYRSLYPAEILDQAERELKQAAEFGRCETTGPRQGKGGCLVHRAHGHDRVAPSGRGLEWLRRDCL